MAKKYDLTTAFTAITETSGTIQNVGKEAVELASSTNAVEGEGIVLNPSEKRSFKGALSARSLGDAGAVVNVVDFTDAGEGGEEYDLPIASKTILGGVKSSDDEGKVTVNNDGTMTYNPLGYRQPSTTYIAGQIAYHSALPTGWYLECTTAGTSGSGDLSISSPSIGGTVSDGTVTWKISKDLSLSGGDMIGRIIGRSVNNSDLYIMGGNTSGGITGATLVLAGKDRTADSGDFFLQAYNKETSTIKQLHGMGTGELGWAGNDLAGSAIVAKSLGANGYIKYASGLILQWGEENVVQNTLQKINLPITIPNIICSAIATVNTNNVANTELIAAVNYKNSRKDFYLSHSYPATIGVSYFLACI